MIKISCIISIVQLIYLRFYLLRGYIMSSLPQTNLSSLPGKIAPHSPSHTTDTKKSSFPMTARLAGLYLLAAMTAGIPGIAMVTATQRKKLAKLHDAAEEKLASLSSFAVRNSKSDIKAQRASSYHSVEETITLLCDKYGVATVTEALRYLENNDVRFNGTNTDLFTIDLKPLWDCIEGYAASAGNRPYSSSKKAQQIPAATKEIAVQLIGLVTRIPVAHKVNDNNSHQLIQSAGHPESDEHGVVFIAPGTTISSHIYKKDNTPALANQSFITLANDKGQPQKVLLSRSARTDSSERIIAKSAGDIAARLKTPGKGGLTLVDTGLHSYYIYQRTDATFLDSSLLKSMGMRAFNFLKNGQPQDERLFLRHKSYAIESLWNSDKVKKDEVGRSYIEHLINHEGEAALVREYRPLGLQFVFSSCAKKTSNLRAARLANLDSMLAMGCILTNKLNLPGLTQAIENYQKDPSDLHRYKLIIELMRAQQNISNTDTLSSMALLGISATLTGKLHNRSIDTVEGSVQLFLYSFILASAIDMPFSIECKSGKDRTATGMAMICAWEEFKLITGRYYDPATPVDSLDFEQFAQLFVANIASFGKATSLASLGAASGDDPRALLKVKSSPVFRHFALQRGFWRQGIEQDVKLA